MKEQGLSLLELLTVLAIVSLLTLSTVPAIGKWQRQLTLRTTTQTILHSLALARQEAVIRGTRVQMASNGSWENGWKIFADLNSDDIHNDEEPLIAAQMPMQHVHIRGNTPVSTRITYRNDGFSILPNNAPQMGTLTICSVPAIDIAYAIKTARGGRARVEEVAGTACIENSD